MEDPTQNGLFKTEKIVYIAPGVEYISNNENLNPSSIYQTRNIDLSRLFTSIPAVNNNPWNLDPKNVPINGIASVPIGEGPFPIAVIAHGNQTSVENSFTGYAYICDLLASHGILAASIDANCLNGDLTGDIGARAILQLEHVKQFSIWNQDSNHPLHNKIDMQRVLLIGHSRGGAAAAYASIYNSLKTAPQDAETGIPTPVSIDNKNGLGPYGFGIPLVIALAPEGINCEPYCGPMVKTNYLVIQGSMDPDLSSFPGYRTFDQAKPVTPVPVADQDSGFKELIWIHSANHIQFNDNWVLQIKKPFFYSLLENIISFVSSKPTPTVILRSDQKKITKAYISAAAQVSLLKNFEYIDFLRNHKIGANWLPTGTTIVTQFQSTNCEFIQDFEETNIGLNVSTGLSGSVSVNNMSAEKILFDLGVTSHLYQATHGVRLEWHTQDASYQVTINNGSQYATSFEAFAFRIGQSFEKANAADQDQDFHIIFSDSNGHSATIRASTIQQIVYPAPGMNTDPKTIMQTFRIPLSDLENAGIDVVKINNVKFTFDITESGVLYLDDLQLTD